MKIFKISIAISLNIYYDNNDTFYYCMEIYDGNDDSMCFNIVKDYIAANKLSGYKTFNYFNERFVGCFVNGILDGLVVKSNYYDQEYIAVDEQLYRMGIFIRRKNMEFQLIQYYETNTYIVENAINLGTSNDNDIRSSYSLSDDGEYVISDNTTLISKWYNSITNKTHHRRIDHSGKVIYNDTKTDNVYEVNGIIKNTIR